MEVEGNKMQINEERTKVMKFRKGGSLAKTCLELDKD
jgi:hypothetical protein